MTTEIESFLVVKASDRYPGGAALVFNGENTTYEVHLGAVGVQRLVLALLEQQSKGEDVDAEKA